MRNGKELILTVDTESANTRWRQDYSDHNKEVTMERLYERAKERTTPRGCPRFCFSKYRLMSLTEKGRQRHMVCVLSPWF